MPRRRWPQVGDELFVWPATWWAPRRPPVNPWRHAFTRAKHFRRAAQLAECDAFDGMLTEDDRFGNPIDEHDRAHLWHRAAANADWGCR